ncbi:MAG: NAD(P)/FAD-dependent oxidoreductase [Variovorax sp.]|nr:NAD(P)/FAD-dependent oxidoreductase [Variovorax sp.]
MPAACDVLVIGAGPAGSACAQTLAREGFDVVLADRHEFPRDKVCGDGLIPDAHRALARLGVLDEVLARARAATRVGCVGPGGGRVEVPARLAVLPRRELDEILRQAALAAGARWLAPVKFDAPLLDDAERVAGARFTRPGGAVQTVKARWTVLATGAAAGPLAAAGVCTRKAPSGIALRGYVKHDAMAGRLGGLEVVWHRALRGGYGWVFPSPGGVFNIGVGLTQRGTGARHDDLNLRALLDAFQRVHPPARELMQGGAVLGPFKGAPLRCSLEGAHGSRPGLLVAGEAAGSTYQFTGEGIGKALETGMLAAQAIAQGADASAQHVCARYEAALDALRPRFAAYEQANRINHQPWLADLLVWRARRSPDLVRRLSGVLEETHDPGRLVTAGGILRLLLPMT